MMGRQCRRKTKITANIPLINNRQLCCRTRAVSFRGVGKSFGRDSVTIPTKVGSYHGDFICFLVRESKDFFFAMNNIAIV